MKKTTDATATAIAAATMNRAPIALVVLLLAACGSSAPPPARGTPAPKADPVAMVAAIRAASVGDDDLFVQPVRDPRVDELRARAEALEARGDYKGAGAAIAEALAITPTDNELLQWRAELSLLRRKWVEAERQANLAYEQGTKLGGLCRRSWSTIAHARQARGDSAGAEVARRQAEACAVPLPVRM
jgi:Flp pilus assembly protein TadD